MTLFANITYDMESRALYRFNDIDMIHQAVYRWCLSHRIYWSSHLSTVNDLRDDPKENVYTSVIGRVHSIFPAVSTFHFNSARLVSFFVQNWIDGPRNDRPITYNKFGNNKDINVLEMIPHCTGYYDELSVLLTSDVGVEYEDWHIFHTESSMKVAFADDELYTWFKLRVSGNQ